MKRIRTSKKAEEGVEETGMGMTQILLTAVILLTIISTIFHLLTPAQVDQERQTSHSLFYTMYSDIDNLIDKDSSFEYIDEIPVLLKDDQVLVFYDYGIPEEQDWKIGFRTDEYGDGSMSVQGDQPVLNPTGFGYDEYLFLKPSRCHTQACMCMYNFNEKDHEYTASDLDVQCLVFSEKVRFIAARSVDIDLQTNGAAMAYMPYEHSTWLNSQYSTFETKVLDSNDISVEYRNLADSLDLQNTHPQLVYTAPVFIGKPPLELDGLDEWGRTFLHVEKWHENDKVGSADDKQRLIILIPVIDRTEDHIDEVMTAFNKIVDCDKNKKLTQVCKCGTQTANVDEYCCQNLADFKSTSSVPCYCNEKLNTYPYPINPCSIYEDTTACTQDECKLNNFGADQLVKSKCMWTTQGSQSCCSLAYFDGTKFDPMGC